MNTDDHDDLWHLLGKAKEPVPSSFFSRNVLRAIREEKQEETGLFAWLRSHWQVVAPGACSILVAGYALTPGTETQSENATMLLAEKVSQSPDFQVIVNFDELLASEESSAWLEN